MSCRLWAGSAATAALALSVVARLPYGRVYGITLPKSPFGKPINPMLFGRRNAVWNNERYFPRSVHAWPLFHKSSLSGPPPPVTVVPNVVQAASPQFAASLVPGTAGGRVANIKAGSAIGGRVFVPVASAACAKWKDPQPANAVQRIVMQVQVTVARLIPPFRSCAFPSSPIDRVSADRL
jgi:hypothetical protein